MEKYGNFFSNLNFFHAEATLLKPITAENSPKNTKISDFLKFNFEFGGRDGRILAKNLSEGPTCAKV